MYIYIYTIFICCGLYTDVMCGEQTTLVELLLKSLFLLRSMRRRGWDGDFIMIDIEFWNNHSAS